MVAPAIYAGRHSAACWKALLPAFCGRFVVGASLCVIIVVDAANQAVGIEVKMHIDANGAAELISDISRFKEPDVDRIFADGAAPVGERHSSEDTAIEIQPAL